MIRVSLVHVRSVLMLTVRSQTPQCNSPRIQKEEAFMQQITIDRREAGQRLDRYLGRYLSEAPKSFIYRMLRKKNIVLNGKKAAGNETLAPEDEIRLWLSDETIVKMGGSLKEADPARSADPQDPSGPLNLPDPADAVQGQGGVSTKRKNSGRHREDGEEGTGLGKFPHTDLDILYEDEHVILINKPAGMLSQKAAPADVSLCEYLIGYLIASGQITESSLKTARPSVCNRLDRNTSGIICCGKSIAGLAALSELLRTRNVHKYYHALVMGRVEHAQRLEGMIQKDESRNVSRMIRSDRKTQDPDGVRKTCTVVKPLRRLTLKGREMTLIEAQLITGRSHQIRASLSAEGHTLVGDIKYATGEEKRFFAEELKQKYQLLHCARMEFPKLDGALAGLSEKTVTAEDPCWANTGRS